MTQYDPDPNTVRPAGPVVTETIETVVVRESNTGWWIAGILAGVVLIAVLWILFTRGSTSQAEQALLDAQTDAAVAQAQADQAAIAGQVAGAQASVEIARADAARSRAEAVRADADARAAEARAGQPLVIERTTPEPAPNGTAVVSPTAPQG